MRTRTQDRRLLKLINFLETLRPKKFYFRHVRTYEDGCMTTGCAIGWCPVIFPKLVAVHHEDKYAFAFPGAAHSYPEIPYYVVSEKLFGVQGALFAPHNAYRIDARLEDLSDDATPKQVAKMLRHYRKLYPCSRL